MKVLTSILACWALLSAPVIAKDAEFSELNLALFDSAHLNNLSGAGQLIYDYKKISDAKTALTDTITVSIDKLKGEFSDQSYVFLTGANQVRFKPRKQQKGNALFLLFLEKDVHQMEQHTKGSWRHFQRRIRWAMAAKDTLKQAVSINYQGQQITGTKYTFQPYANDPKKARYGIYINKYYSFTLADNIPGTLYQMRSYVLKDNTGTDSANNILHSESITFSSFLPAKQ